MALLLAVAGCHAFLGDSLIKHLYKYHHESWLSYGSPSGQLYKPKGGKYSSYIIFTKKLNLGEFEEASWLKVDDLARKKANIFLRCDRTVRKGLPFVIGMAILGLLLAK